MSVKAQNIQMFVKGAGNNQLGDCPFCHRCLLIAEEKKVPYERVYIEFSNKPQWLVDLNGGSVPALKSGEKVLSDSGQIIEFLEQNYPDPSSKPNPQSAEVGGKFMPAFVNFVTSKPDNEAQTKKDFEAQLSEIDGALGKQSKGPFFGEDHLNDTDANIAPKLLRHAVVALKHYKNYEFLSRYGNIKKYNDEISQAQPWKSTYYSDQIIIEGWKSKVEGS